MKTRIADYVIGAICAALVVAIAYPQIARATGLSAATYAKKSDTIVKTEGGASLHLVEFTITGGSGDTYTTSGISPAASSLGFSGFKILQCEPVSVAWTSYTTVARAIVMRSTNVQLANGTSINGTVFNCRGLAYE